MTLVQPLITIGTSAGTLYTSDGGATVTTITSTNASVVPARQPSAQLQHGSTAGNLRSFGTILYTFAAAISSIFVNPANETRLLVGLSNGELWRSLDAGATWTLLWIFGLRIAQLFESADALQIYVVADKYVWVSQNSFNGAPLTWASFSTSATAVLISGFGNYATAANGTVLNVDTNTVLSGPTSPVLGLDVNPKQGTLWVLEQNGTFWRMPTGGSSLSILSTVPGGGGELVAVTPIAGLILAANGLGAWVSPDAGVTWRRIVATAATSIGWYTAPIPGSF